jgi:hypothetical protein
VAPLILVLALTGVTDDSVLLDWTVEGPLDGFDHYEVWRLQGATFTRTTPGPGVLVLAAALAGASALALLRRRRGRALGLIAACALAGLAWTQTGGSGEYVRIDSGDLTDPGVTEFVDTGLLFNTTYCYFVRAVRGAQSFDSNVNCAVTGTGVDGPAIARIVPSVGWNGQDTPVTLVGSNLTEAPARIALEQAGLTVAELTGIQLVSSTQIDATVPAGLVPGLYDVRVVFSGIAFVLPGAFTVTDIPPPELLSIFPESGWNGAPTLVTLTGRGFLPVPAVTMIGPDGRLVTLENLIFVRADSLTAVVPGGLPPGDYTVVVTNPNGLSSQLVAAFRVSELRPPDILDVNPTQLRANSGQTPDGLNPVATVRFVTPGAQFSLLPEAGNPIPLQVLTTIPPECDPCDLEFRVPPSQQLGPYVLRVENPDRQFDLFGTILLTPSAPGKLAGDWAIEAERLVLARQKLAATGAGLPLGSRFLVAAGGETGDSALRPVEVAPLDLFGHVGRWGLTRPMLTARSGLGLFTTSAEDGAVYVYAYGGSSELDGTPALGTGERARLLDERTVPQDLALAAGAGSLASGNWVYRVSAVTAADGEGLPGNARSVTLAAAGGAALSWSPVTDATSYRVYRSDEPNIGSGREHLVATVAAPTTSHSDAGATPIVRLMAGPVAPTPSGTGGSLAAGTYLYRATAFTIHGETGASAEVSTVVPGLGTGSVQLSWPAFNDAGFGDAPLYYNLYRSDPNGAAGTSVLIQEKIVQTSFTDTGGPPILASAPQGFTGTAVLIPNATLASGTWTYQVSALTDRGETLPTAALNVAVAAPNNAVTLGWTQISDAISYRVYRSDAPGGLTLHRIAEGIRGTGFSDQGAAAGTELPADGRQLPPPGWLLALPPGTLGLWQALPADKDLVSPRYGHGMTTHIANIGGTDTPMVFAIGGNEDPNDPNNVEQATVDSTGALSAWSVSAESLQQGRRFMAVDWADSETVPAFQGTATAYLQVTHGIAGTSALDSIEWAPLGEGVLGAFQSRTGRGRLWGHGVGVTNGFLYAIGGVSTSGGGIRRQVDLYTIEPGTGGITSGTSAAEFLTGSRGLYGAARVGTRIYAIGGNTTNANNPSLTDTVESIPF